jgi:pimeloyl-ACP methyl ester carboxylesterase
MSAMFDLHGISKASMVAHSYGTFYVSCLLKLAPEKVHSMTLIDPVCCCMVSLPVCLS